MIILVITLVGSERNPEIAGNSLKLLYKQHASVWEEVLPANLQRIWNMEKIAVKPDTSVTLDF